jgi:NLI interacting factor-like phosphatase
MSNPFGDDDDDEWEMASISLEELTNRLKLDTLASVTSSGDSSAPNLLVLLDMNGTLLCRAAEKLGGQAKKHDCRVLKNYCYFRNDAKRLVKWLEGHPRIDLCFYTSMKKKSAEPLSEHLLGEASSIYLFDQEYNKRDMEGRNSWSMMRDMPRIWSQQDSPSFGHSEKSTIMIDDSYEKMREYPDNVFIVPEYTEEVIELGDPSDDTVLDVVIQFLDKLTHAWTAKSETDDVRVLIRELLNSGEFSYATR